MPNYCRVEYIISLYLEWTYNNENDELWGRKNACPALKYMATGKRNVIPDNL